MTAAQKKKKQDVQSFILGESASTNLERLKSGGGKLFTRLEHDLPPGGVALTTSSPAPAAREALSPNELEARIEVYAILVAARKPLPLFGVDQA